jgi:hypothetical protein
LAVRVAPFTPSSLKKSSMPHTQTLDYFEDNYFMFLDLGTVS